LTDSPAPLEPHQLEELEFERKRRRSQKFLAFDMIAELHGQAEWQRFRRSDPPEFLRSKIDVQAGPAGLWSGVQLDPYGAAFLLRFECPVWRPGSVRRLDLSLSRREIERDENDDFLRFTAEDAAGIIRRESGVDTRILVRGNREAWNWHEDHKYDQPTPGLCALPPRRRVAGEFCGTCKARFRTEDLRARFCDSSGMRLPCGHQSVGVWEEEI
jgi:hypothetical protein